MEQTIKYRGFDIQIIRESEDSESPREWANAGTMVCWHSNYNLGDEQPTEDAGEYLYNLAGYVQDFEELNQQQVMARLNKTHIILPLYLYDHSGISISTGSFGDPWDSGQVGFIHISKKDAVKEWGTKNVLTKNTCTNKVRLQAIKCLKAEVKNYDDYLRGEVYGYNIEDKRGNYLDACWGFFGGDPDESGIIDEAKSVVDYHIGVIRASHLKRLKEQIKSKAPLYSRSVCPL